MINTIDHIINIDLANKINMNQSINIKQNDTNSHKFIINIFNNSVVYDLTGTTSRIYFEKSDATKVFLDCVLDDTIVNKLSCLLTTQALSYVGLVASEITIYGTAGEILTSVTFNFTVSEVIRDDMAIESTSEFTALTNALNALDEAVVSIPTVEALNVDLQNNIITGDALDITLKDDIATGNITDTNIKDSTIIGDATDADLKADIIIAGQNEFATEITNARGGEINLDTRLDKVDISLADNATEHGDLALLATTDKTSIVNAINENFTNANSAEIGDLSLIAETDLVSAIQADRSQLATMTYQKIVEQNLVSAVSQVDFINIPSGYRNLKILCDVISNSSTGSILIRFNDDSSNNYYYQRFKIAGTTLTPSSSSGGTGIFGGSVPPAGGTFGFGTIEISNMKNTIEKSCLVDSIANTIIPPTVDSMFKYIAGGTWNNKTDLINKISLSGVQFGIGCRFSLWGCK